MGLANDYTIVQPTYHFTLNPIQTEQNSTKNAMGVDVRGT